MTEKRCIVCGEVVQGRSDKKFCSTECKSFHNNLQKRELTIAAEEDKHVKRIRRNILVLFKNKRKHSLKILAHISQVFKIMTTFRNN